MVNINKCCGREMKINIETTGFIELQCEKCGDVVYVKRGATAQRPVMLDD